MEPKKITRNEFGLITSFFASFFRILQYFPPQLFIGNRIDNMKNSDYENLSDDERTKLSLKRIKKVEIYILSIIVLEILSVVAIAQDWLNYGFFHYTILVFAILRIIDIIQINVNLSLYDPIRTGAKLNFVGSAIRIITNVFFNYLELIICFGIVYSLNSQFNSLQNVTDWTDAFYYSFITQVTMGFDQIIPIRFIKLISCIQMLIGFIFTALIIGRFIGVLIQVKTVAGDSQFDE